MNWISVEDKMPPVNWSELGGKKVWNPQTVLLLRKLQIRGGSKYTVSVGEYDNTGDPGFWRTWDDFVDEYGYEDSHTRELDDVTHWMPLPEPPKQ